MEALSHTSSPASIYHVCATYHTLYTLRQLRSVAKLLSCITSHNHTYKFVSIDAAFADHRILTLDPDERQRRRKRRRLALVEERDSLRAQLRQQQEQQQCARQSVSQQGGPAPSTPVTSPHACPSLHSTAPCTLDNDCVLPPDGVVVQLVHQRAQCACDDTLQLARQREYMATW